MSERSLFSLGKFDSSESDQINVAVGEKNFLQFGREAIVPCTVKSLLYIKKECSYLFVLTAGCHYGFNQSHQLMNGRIPFAEDEVFGDQNV